MKIFPVFLHNYFMVRILKFKAFAAVRILQSVGVLLILIIPQLLFSQKTTPPPTAKPVAATTRDTAIAKLFEQPASIKWVRVFKGRVDDASAVDMTLGYDGRSCRGYLNYLKSKTRIRLEGTLVDSTQLRLEERGAGNVVVGRWEGRMSKRRLEADWTNVNNSLGIHLSADEFVPGLVLNLACSENKWANHYISRYNGARVDLVLMRIQNNALRGYCWIETDDKTYTLQGKMDKNGEYEMEALLPSGRVAAQMAGSIEPGRPMTCIWVGSGEKRAFNFILKGNYALGCYDYADYSSSYDALYPRTACTTCNTWFDQQLTVWVNRCKSVIAAKKDPPTAATRSAQRASAWSEIACWTDHVFSGYLTFSDTWSEQAQGMAYNFDLRTGKSIVLEELFNKGFNPKTWLEDYARKEMPKMPQFAANPKYREWLNKEGFPLFALRREGLEISTLFHPQYGRQSLLVPYSALKPYMKKENPVAEFVK
ncbi:MAG: hypothetical protein LH618_01415 [Saprospiraceae bacterium]|nr:hypothetical protein [Saprospiraceae bacterium]